MEKGVPYLERGKREPETELLLSETLTAAIRTRAPPGRRQPGVHQHYRDGHPESRRLGLGLVAGFRATSIR